MIAGLQVFPENIKKNLNLSRGGIMAEAVITQLVKKGLGRQAAHEILRTSSLATNPEPIVRFYILLTIRDRLLE